MPKCPTANHQELDRILKPGRARLDRVEGGVTLVGLGVLLTMSTAHPIRSPLRQVGRAAFYSLAGVALLLGGRDVAGLLDE